MLIVSSFSPSGPLPSPAASATRVFDKNLLQLHRERAQKNFTPEQGSDFMLRWAERELTYRLEDIKRRFPQATLLSPSISEEFSDYLTTRCDHLDFKADQALGFDEILEIEPKSQDLIISLFELQKINDVTGWLIQSRLALKEDGAFIGCCVGGNSLFQLRQSLLAAEIKVMGGASPRVAPLMTKQQLGGLLQRAGFALPVVDSEDVTADYRDIFHLMKDLRAMGESNALTHQQKQFTPSRLFHEAGVIYQERFQNSGKKLPATFEVIFFIGWGPSATQPQPLKPGAAHISLKDLLE